MIWRWKAMSSSTTGRATISAAATPGWRWPARCPRWSEPDLGGLEAVVVDDRLGPQVLVPGAEGRDDRERGDDRPGQRHREAPQEGHVAVAVEAGGVLDLGGHAAEPLADEEGAEGGGRERQHQGLRWC